MGSDHRPTGGVGPAATPPPASGGPDPVVQVIRSSRRKRTISGRLVGNVIEIRVPSGMGAQEEAAAVRRITERVLRRREVRTLDDTSLFRRARELSRTCLGVADPPLRQARYVDMRTRWGSSTPKEGSIRIAARLRSLPTWVEDYVIVHEVAHLLCPQEGHGPRFWRLVGRYPRTERARGYLEAVVAFDAAARGDPVPGPGALDETDLFDAAAGCEDVDVDADGDGASEPEA